ncbi:hypothetical protein KCP73_13370 [Salmonella enterica subsp. enterica]|nr:hypothetical protein KCP73_13370 [Salmonella enterica subsp. enterica]
MPVTASRADGHRSRCSVNTRRRHLSSAGGVSAWRDAINPLVGRRFYAYFRHCYDRRDARCWHR